MSDQFGFSFRAAASVRYSRISALDAACNRATKFAFSSERRSPTTERKASSWTMAILEDGELVSHERGGEEVSSFPRLSPTSGWNAAT
ncbi:hypothetical protein [Roseivivax sediminis]|uniref:hypothetical protein n=1 Tax=Roseivivax sediminis TaxID=936889 RepID=UPI00122C9A3E|nr:hypothetical protein [Roseivivax sediminis]